MRNGVGFVVATASLFRLFQVILRKRKATSLQEHPFSTFLADARAGRLIEVLFGVDDFLVTSRKNIAGQGGATSPIPVPSQVEKYRTRPVASFDRSKLIEQLTSSGVRFAAQSKSAMARLQSALLLAVPFFYLACVGALVHRMQNPRGGTVGRMKRGASSTGQTGAQASVLQWLRKWFGFASSGETLDPGNEASSPTFADVAGVDSAKLELQELVSFLQCPEKFETMGCHIPRGVLLSGPAGTGKTLLARALANEAKVSFFYASASEFVETLVGRGAARVRDLFARARAGAPAIVFIDEIDALGRARGGLNSNEEREQTLMQILTEMDGFDQHGKGWRPAATMGHGEASRDQGEPGNGGSGGSAAASPASSSSSSSSSPVVLVVAATNRPHVLDPALLRPGRFDRHVAVHLPDTAGRLAILRTHARRVRLAGPEQPVEQPLESHNPRAADNSRAQTDPNGSTRAAEPSSGCGERETAGSDASGGGPAADLAAVAARTEGLSGADLANVVNEAALLAVREGSSCVRQAHLDAAVEKQWSYGSAAAAPGTGGFVLGGF